MLWNGDISLYTVAASCWRCLEKRTIQFSMLSVWSVRFFWLANVSHQATAESNRIKTIQLYKVNWFSCFANFRIFNVELVISTVLLFYFSIVMALISVAMSFMRANNLTMKIYRLKCMTATWGRCTFWKRFNPIYFRKTQREKLWWW